MFVKLAGCNVSTVFKASIRVIRRYAAMRSRITMYCSLTAQLQSRDMNGHSKDGTYSTYIPQPTTTPAESGIPD